MRSRMSPPSRALAAAERSAPGDPRPFAGRADRDQGQPPGRRACRSRWAATCSATSSPRHDAFLVRRLRDAGFVIVGKTSLPEMGILPTTEPRRFGPTAQPVGRSTARPAARAAASAAAVAAGMVPVAHGNDGGGSIRIPAACCGLVGLKPARGRVSVGPDGGHSFLVFDGVLTRTVADTAAVLDVLAGYELGDATWAPPPPTDRSPSRGARDPGACGSRWRSTRRSTAPPLDPVCERRRARRGGAARVARPRRRGDHAAVVGPGPAPGLHPAVRAAWSSLDRLVGGALAGREPDRETSSR